MAVLIKWFLQYLMTTLIISVHLEKSLSKWRFIMNRIRLGDLSDTIMLDSKTLVKFKFIKEHFAVLPTSLL